MYPSPRPPQLKRGLMNPWPPPTSLEQGAWCSLTFTMHFAVCIRLTHLHSHLTDVHTSILHHVFVRHGAAHAFIVGGHQRAHLSRVSRAKFLDTHLHTWITCLLDGTRPLLSTAQESYAALL